MDDAQAREALRRKYESALQRVWSEADTCPICGTNNWSLNDLVDVPLRTDPDPSLQGHAYVYVPLGCTHCGYTMFFHSGTLEARLAEAQA
jgi:predicted nucleic-acid-binding Zn-ribbon protein